MNAPFHFFHFTAPPLSPPENSALSFRIVLLSSELGKSPSFETLERDLGFPRHRQRLSLSSSSLFGLRQAKQANVVSLTRIRRLSRRINWSNWKRNRPIRNGTWSIGVGNNGSTDRTCQASAYHVAHQTFDIRLELDFDSFLEGRHIYHLARRV